MHFHSDYLQRFIYLAVCHWKKYTLRLYIIEQYEMKQNGKPGSHTVKFVILKALALLQFFCFEFRFYHIHTNGQKQIW